MKDSKRKLSTEAIHGGSKRDRYGSLITPIYNTSTYIFDSTAQGAARFALEEPGLIRLSVGLENVEDIIDDLKQAFEKI